ncbi:glycoside hydrolase family 81 protein [Planoprotostelium fungivorum]|uniref:glucan endo-1,3-beta-D-glucosidase n=1 Tax=Planoprotostelium fungivorum TaxID=1890364 RepID=A0A2P6MR04_9EUKA|nr:glycoside hydrolase family 81 protein [Planoprotostelium fungivorum]
MLRCCTLTSSAVRTFLIKQLLFIVRFSSVYLSEWVLWTRLAVMVADRYLTAADTPGGHSFPPMKRYLLHLSWIWGDTRHTLRQLLIYTVALSSVGDPVSTKEPSLPKVSVYSVHPDPYFSDVTASFPTNSWWTRTLAPSSPIAGPFPFQSILGDRGVSIGASTPVSSSQGLQWKPNFELNITLGTDVPISQPKAEYWDSLTLRMRWGTNNRYMRAVMVQGSPFFTIEYRGTTPNIDYSADWMKSSSNNRTTLTNRVTGDAWQIWNLPKTSNVDGVYRFARVSIKEQIQYLNSRVNTYPTAVRINYSIYNETASVTYNFTTVGNPRDLVVLSWPHHRDVMRSDIVVDGTITMATMRGDMKSVSGNIWTLIYPLPPVNMTQRVESSCEGPLGQMLHSEAVTCPSQTNLTDLRSWGMGVHRLARLVEMTSSMGMKNESDVILMKLKDSYAPWYDRNISGGIYPAYDVTWRGVVMATDPLSFFSSGPSIYNDHPSLYGYFLYGFSVMMKMDPTWAAPRKYLADEMVRDYANPSTTDHFYPVVRSYDFFHGNTWDNSFGAGGVNVERNFGESLHGYHAISVYGDSSGNRDLTNWGRLLVSMATNSLRYRLLYNSTQDPHSEPFPSSSLYNRSGLFPFVSRIDSGIYNDINIASSGLDLSTLVRPLTALSRWMIPIDWASQWWSHRGDYTSTMGGEMKNVMSILSMVEPITLRIDARDQIEGSQVQIILSEVIGCSAASISVSLSPLHTRNVLYVAQVILSEDNLTPSQAMQNLTRAIDLQRAGDDVFSVSAARHGFPSFAVDIMRDDETTSGTMESTSVKKSGTDSLMSEADGRTPKLVGAALGVIFIGGIVVVIIVYVIILRKRTRKWKGIDVHRTDPKYSKLFS